MTDKMRDDFETAFVERQVDLYGEVLNGEDAQLLEIAKLRAENEALLAAAQALRDEWRKDQADAERYRWLRVKQTFIWLIQDWFPRNNVLTDVDAEIDAAMGKGEQS